MSSDPGSGGARRPRSSLALAVAVSCCAGGVPGALAQSVPYESPMRAQVGTGFGQEQMAKGGVFTPRIEAAVQYAANVNLAEDGLPQVDMAGLEVAPGLYASYSSDSLIAAIDYSVIGRAWEESDYNDISQIGAANGRWIAVPEFFYVDAQGSIIDAVIDPADGLNFGGLGIFAPSNLSQQATASVSPTFDRRFGDFELLAQYSYGRVWYFDEGDNVNQVGFLGQDDSRDQSASVSIGNSQSGRKLTGSLFYNWQKSDYDNALPYNYEQLGVNLGWQVTPSTSLVGSAGVESDLDESTTEGGLDSGFWDVGFLWEPDDRTQLEARYGDRFFGHTYFLSAQRTVRMLEFTASYSESPQVQTQILSLGDFTPGDLPPATDPGIDFGRLNSQPYVGKNANVGVAAIGSRTRLSLNGFRYVQDFIREARSDDSHTGGALTVSRQLASNLDADFSASYTDYEQSQPASSGQSSITTTSDYTQFIARLNRQSSGGRLTTSLEAGYVISSGDQDYDAWWVGVRARWTR